MTEVLRLFAVAEEESFLRVKRFFDANPSEFVLGRPDRQLMDAIEQRLFFAIESNQHDRLVAVSGAFNMDQCLPDIAIQMGASRIADDYQKCSLHSVLHKIRLLAVADQLVNFDLIVTVIRGDNVNSIASARRAGFVPWDVDHPRLMATYHDILAANRASADPRDQRPFFGFDVSHLPRLAKDILAGDRVLTQRTTGRQFKLQLDLRLLRSQHGRAFLRAVADGSLTFKQYPFRPPPQG